MHASSLAPRELFSDFTRSVMAATFTAAFLDGALLTGAGAGVLTRGQKDLDSTLTRSSFLTRKVSDLTPESRYWRRLTSSRSSGSTRARWKSRTAFR